MPPQNPIHKSHPWYITFGLIATAVCAVLVLHHSFYDQYVKLKSFVKDNSPTQVVGAVHAIKEEVKDSGKLIAGVNYPNALLTYAGTVADTNAERTKATLATFTSNATLDTIAQIRLKDMFAKQYFEHVSPTGDSAAKEADANGYQYLLIGENIALGNFQNDEALVTAWMNSPGHRANILNSKFTDIGIAVGKGTYNGETTWIAVQVFGRPLSECPAVDAMQKTIIGQNEDTITSNQMLLDTEKQELEAMRHDPNVSKETYDQKVDVYNILVRSTNVLIAAVKTEVNTYNMQVRAFNTCLQGDS